MKHIMMIGRWINGAKEEHYNLLPAAPSAATPTDDRYWQGYNAQRDGVPLAALDNDTAELGWWAAKMKFGNNGKFDGCIEDDTAWVRSGGSRS